MNIRKTEAFLAACMLLTVTGCSSVSMNDPGYITSTESEQSTMSTAASEEPTTEVKSVSSSVSFVAVGDNLIHTRVYKTAEEHAADGEAYNFRYCYENVTDEIAEADLAFINQETIICNGEFEISGSNLNFNSPNELGDTLIDLGFDIIGMANNHVLDKGESGMRACLDYWDSRVELNPDVLVLGAYRDYQDMFDYRITEANGVSVGVLAYTDHTNGYSLPTGSEMEIPYLADTELIERQIKELKEQVDCVVVSAHWGVEDTHTVPDSVKQIAADMVNWGADIIIGTGPHTLQTMEYLTRPDGSRGFVYYSLGNFISGQTDNFNMVGGMAKFDIVKNDGAVTIEHPVLTPVITQYETGDLKDVRVYPYYLYTDELAANHGIPYSPLGTAKNWSWDVINTIVENNVPEEFRKLDQ